MNKISLLLLPVFILVSCSESKKSSKINRLSDDLSVIEQRHQPIILSEGDSKIIILAEYQGRVMTSSATGIAGESYGWINYDNLLNPDNTGSVGGADRLWFGPETGQFSLFFKPDKERTVENISIPAAFSTIPFNVKSQTDDSVTFEQHLTIENHNRFVFDLDVVRTISLFSQQTIKQKLGITYNNLHVVGFGSKTAITNVGKKPWNLDTGLLSIWSLGAFLADDDNTAVIPFKNDLSPLKEYFTPIIESHTREVNGAVFYRADAKYLNKIGISPKNTKPVMGSYDHSRQLLTIVNFQFDGHKDDLYVSSVWTDKNALPYSGDVTNVFNGGVEDGVSMFGHFYELESSSAAKPLRINESQYHYQNTYHFQGSEAELNQISLTLLGFSLSEIHQVFN